VAETRIDLATWPRADQFRLFRTYAKPHFATTARVDATHLTGRRKADGVSPYRACLYAIGAGLHAVPELLTRFRGDTVVRHDTVALSMTVPRDEGGFTFGYVPFHPDFPRFDSEAARLIAEAAATPDFKENAGRRDDVAFLSCLPWLDYTSLDNAISGPDDCIPRISWGRIVDHGTRRDMAMTLEVHHALVDGVHVGRFFAAVQEALDRV
jgi:chloramphenicol O-acetyltransferase type A